LENRCFNQNIGFSKKHLKKKIPKEQIIELFDNRDEIIRLNITPVALVEEIAKNNRQTSDTDCSFFETSEDVADPKNLHADKQNLVVFDHLVSEKQNTCEAYYVRGRHSNIDCFYLSQNYFKLPRQTIRENMNFICLFPQDLKNISHIYNDHVSTDMSKEEFRKLCESAWSQRYGFVVIDLSSEKHNGKYRSGFDNFISLII